MKSSACHQRRFSIVQKVILETDFLCDTALINYITQSIY